MKFQQQSKTAGEAEIGEDLNKSIIIIKSPPAQKGFQ
jgi:hypothetical protein